MKFLQFQIVLVRWQKSMPKRSVSSHLWQGILVILLLLLGGSGQGPRARASQEEWWRWDEC
ncbi:hypothetical protein RRF57_004900 [Xylaria bambusicola]|uniref:Uncharacterized protein n=1 Tax=Xylaria bambusicola TaxID=326684 RepID=A0AAN7UBG1_9PEZI